MSKLEIRKKKLDCMKLSLSISESEYKIEEKLADIERIKGNIKSAGEQLTKLEETIKAMEANDE